MTDIVFVSPSGVEFKTVEWHEAPGVNDEVTLGMPEGHRTFRVIRRRWLGGRCYAYVAEIDTGYDSRNRPG